jgi:hypothetical protein
MSTLEKVYAAAQRGEYVDLVVRCGPTSFGLNYAILAMECGYFRTMHSTLLGDTCHTDPTVARLECDPALFSLVVRCIYTGAIDPGIEVDVALDVLALAVYLECDLAQRIVTDRIDLSGWCLDPDTAVRVWEHAHRVCASAARRLAASHIAGAMPRAARTPALLAMQKEELVSLLSSDEFTARSEVHVAEALGAWGEANNEPFTALDSRVVRLVWHDPVPRDRCALRGILVLPADSRRFQFLTAGHEWVDGVVPDLASPRGEGAALCHLRGAAYAMGGKTGTCSIERCGGRDTQWTAHDYSAGSRSQVSCAVLGTCIYVVGGVSGMRPCEYVNVVDVDSCLKGGIRMGRERRMCCVAETGGSLLVAGGFDSICSALAHAEMLEPASSAPPMLEPRAAAACASIGADVYVAGGIGGVHAPVCTAEYYDAGNREWVALPPMPRSRSYCAGAFIGRAFYVIGGIEYGRKTTSFFRFDVAASVWSEHPAPALGECAATRYTHMSGSK